MPDLSILRPIGSAWHWLRNASIRSADKQRETGTYRIWDMLRHANVKRHKYVVTVHLMGGAVFTGRVNYMFYSGWESEPENGAFSVSDLLENSYESPTTETFFRLDQVAAVTMIVQHQPKEEDDDNDDENEE